MTNKVEKLIADFLEVDPVTRREYLDALTELLCDRKGLVSYRGVEHRPEMHTTHAPVSERSPIAIKMTAETPC